MNNVAFAGDQRLQTAPCGQARWFVHTALWRPNDPDGLTTGDHETAVLLLGGTFDLVGGGTVWPARGARKHAFAGRPMAVFLPPRTEFRTGNGRGEILLIAARQPQVKIEPTGRDALSNKPLLPLAGSGKAFDPKTGEWLPAEAFPTAPESLPPRRFERVPVGACVIERVFAPSYKAATLSVDEVVLPAGATLALRDVPGRAAHDEVLLFVRANDEQDRAARVTIAGESHEVRGDAVFVVPTPGGEADVTLAAANAPLYAVLAYAGKPDSGS